MAFFQTFLKAQKLENAKLRYEDEKLKSIIIMEGGKINNTFTQKLRRQKLRCKRKTREIWRNLTSCPKNSWFHQKAVLLRTNGTFENYAIKSVFGFIGGIFLTYLFFMFFVFQLNFTLQSATLLCSSFGIILTLGLAFSYRIRCLVFLLLPQLFSKRGRQALMAYAFILALTGPAKNTLHNIGVLSESLACGQKQLKDDVKAVVDLIRQPFNAIKDSITKVIKTVRIVVEKIKTTLIAIKKIVLVKVIKSAFDWLGSIVNMCNKKLGTPFERCQRVFEGAVADCKAKLGPIFGEICNLTYVVSSLCYIVKPLDFVCILVSYVADTVIDSVRRRVRKFTKHIKAMFYVRVKFSHSFHFETNHSRTIEDVSKGIVTEIKVKTEKFLTVFDWMNFGTSFFVFFILLRVIHYRQKWLTSDRFDNKYITDDLRRIDLIRTRQRRETVLPLNRRERNKYIPLTSMKLITAEKFKLARSTVFLGLATFKLCIHMMADYSLYWVLNTIRYHGRFQTKLQKPNSVGVYVSGNGYLADLYRSIVKTFSPRAENVEMDYIPCLPDPIPSDLDRYAQIVSLIVLCWLMAIFEPYGLRIRHVVMCHYYPSRARQRATWLYNHILRSRGSFLKFVRRRLRRQYGIIDNERIEKVTLKERIMATCPFFYKLFHDKRRRCLLCGAIERSEQRLHFQCKTPNCIGVFCIPCFIDLQNLCTICRSPIEYGDLSDFSEEKDSSEDQLIIDEQKKLYFEKISQDKIETIKDDGNTLSQKDDTEKIEKIDVTKQTSDTTILEQTESNLSYSYGERTPSTDNIDGRSTSFCEFEAQKIRDDISIQILNEPPTDFDESSVSDESVKSFVIGTKRKLKTRVKRKSCLCLSQEYQSASISIPNLTVETESSEELSEEEITHIEIDSREKLITCSCKKEKRQKNQMQKIITFVKKFVRYKK